MVSIMLTGCPVNWGAIKFCKVKLTLHFADIIKAYLTIENDTKLYCVKVSFSSLLSEQKETWQNSSILHVLDYSIPCSEACSL